MTGHLLGAAGAVESITSILSINNNTIPATINTETLDEAIPESIHIVLEKSLEKEVNYVMNNTFGFGGHTVTTIFKKFNN
ncbi:3-oxoacyl-[acyl-carrier-protein] synthase 2 [compost metagenome]